MDKNLDTVRALVARNAALLRRASDSDRLVREAAEKEIARIDAALASMPQGAALLGAAVGDAYRKLVFQRGELQQLLAGEPGA